MTETLRIGISTCPNDTFAFHALMTRKITIPGIELSFSLLDIEQLNEGLLRNAFDVAKASFHLALLLTDRYCVLPSGSALGFGVGPLLLAARAGTRPDAPDGRNGLVLCPGKLTTASLLFRLFYPESTRIEQIVFSDIMPRLQRGSADFGVCIHEGRFTWQESGLSLVEDLGDRWEQTFQTPLPLGGILASLDLPHDTIRRVQDGLQASIDYAWDHIEETLPTMRHHAQEFNDAVLMQHVELYVNQWTKELGASGREALQAMRTRAIEVGLVDAACPPLLVWDGGVKG